MKQDKIDFYFGQWMSCHNGDYNYKPRPSATELVKKINTRRSKYAGGKKK